MRILIVTQTLDSQDSNLGFFHRWVEEFSKHCESVIVICLQEGEYQLPENVRIYSLGKESGRKNSFIYAWHFLKLITKLRKQYNAVFVHMNPEYVVLGGIFWKIWCKRIGLWYVHRKVDFKLRVAAVFADVIFTASKESFRLKSSKVKIVGHGIEVENFSSTEPGNQNRAVTVGRISRSKNLEILLDAVALVPEISLDIYGATHTPDDRDYLAELERRVNELGIHERVLFAGVVPHQNIPELLSSYRLFLHASGTGSLDKAGLESMAAGGPVISSSEAFEEILKPYGLFVKNGTAENFAGAIEKFGKRGDREAVAAQLRREVSENHSLTKLIPKILSAYQK